LVRRVRQPQAVDGDVAGDRIGRDGGGLDLSLEMLTADSRSPASCQDVSGTLANAKTDNAVADIGRQLAPS
jgi:hypothetical protein